MATQPAFTPGPWRVDPSYDSDIQSADGSLEIASVHPGVLTGGEKPQSLAEIRANARLIAAAPDMLAALTGLLPYLDAIVCYASTMDEHEPNRIAAEARAAIAKARGEVVA